MNASASHGSEHPDLASGLWAMVRCGYCRGTGLDRWNLLSPLSVCSACAGRGEQAVLLPYRTCAYCKGEGVHPGLRMTCTACHGLGVVHVSENAVNCSRCAGTGVEPGSERKLSCLDCKGTGWRSPAPAATERQELP